VAASRCAAEVVQSGTGIVHAHRLLIPNKCLLDDTEAVCTRCAEVFKGSSKGGMVVVQKLVVRCSLMGDHIVRRRKFGKRVVVHAVRGLAGFCNSFSLSSQNPETVSTAL
jgi:hypothetical protein